MQFNRILIAGIFCSCISKIDAGELGAKLNTQIELLPSCSINNNSIVNEESKLNFGEINFGEATASFNGTIESSLINSDGVGLKIQCAGMASVKVKIGSGQNGNKIPIAFSGEYYYALSNGKDFLAYNLLFGADRVVIKPNDSFTLKNTSQVQEIYIFGRVVNNGYAVSTGNYIDLVSIVVEF